MSRLLSVPLRERWAARSMVLRQWLVRGGTFRPGDAICELEIEGEPKIFLDNRLHPQDIGGVYHHFVAEGHEVPPSGYLLEFSDSVATSRKCLLHETAHRPLIRRREYPRFFVNYRRDDAEPYAWRLHESLCSSWGDVDVFMDQASIQPGEIFPWTIQQAAVHSKTMLVLIGPKWLTLVDRDGKRRIDNETDYVRREAVAALDRGTLVVPILLAGAAVPDKYALPRELEALHDVQFYELNHRHWREDVGRLKDHLETHFKQVLRDHIS